MSQRVWALVLAAVMFLAGIAAANLWKGPAQDLDMGIEPRAKLFEASFDLSKEQSRVLRKLLEHYDRDVRQTQARGGPNVGRELVALARSYSTMLRDNILPPDQRERYDRMLTDFLPTPSQR